MPSGGPPRRPALIALVVVAVSAGLVAWWFFGRDDSTTPAPPAPAVESSAPVDESDGDATIGQIGVDAIEDAGALVDALGPDDGEAELLAELGLDPSGEPLPPASDPVGHEFSWAFADGVTATITVDSVTGDHSYVDSTGLSFRKVGELAFGKPSADQPWAMIDDSQLASIQRLGLDRPLTVDDLVDGPVSEYASVSGDGSIWSIDEAAFQASDAAGRDAWASAVGLPVESPAGLVTIWVSTGADGATVSTASIERGSSGETTTYQLARLFDRSPAISAPEL